MKQILTMTVVFAAAAAFMLALLVIAALIPKEKIKDNSLISAEYLCAGEQFGSVIEDIDATCIDRYADAILLNIAYCYDSRSPLRTVLLSAYYFSPFHEENENFMNAVKKDLTPNQQYMRYWHGSIALVRPLLIFLSIKQIYTLNAVVLVSLTAVLAVMLLKRKKRCAVIALASGLIAGGSIFVPLSLEYTWTYLVMLTASIIAVKLADRDSFFGYMLFFMLTGMVTSYLDFLTTETLTFTVPFIILVWLKKTDSLGRNVREAFVFFLNQAVSWGIGYAGMWVLKWVLTAAVFAEDVLPYVSGHISERLGGDMGIGLFAFLTGALMRNAGCLFPAGYGTAGIIAAFLLIFMAAYIGYVYHVNSFHKRILLLLALTGLIPFVRYLILHNHSYIHFFFTYRAQVATVMALVLIIAELKGLGGAEHG